MYDVLTEDFGGCRLPPPTRETQFLPADGAIRQDGRVDQYLLHVAPGHVVPMDIIGASALAVLSTAGDAENPAW